jgi:Rrf2 family protein
MKISRTISYAIQASLHLARAEPGAPVPCSQLAREGRLPARFLLQILRRLVNQGLLQSARGVDGGYFLARQPQQITLLDIVEAFDNPLDPAMPKLDGMSIGVRSSILRTLHDVAHASRLKLQKLSVADLIAADGNVTVGGRCSATR